MARYSNERQQSIDDVSDNNAFEHTWMHTEIKISNYYMCYNMLVTKSTWGRVCHMHTANSCVRAYLYLDMSKQWKLRRYSIVIHNGSIENIEVRCTSYVCTSSTIANHTTTNYKADEMLSHIDNMIRNCMRMTITQIIAISNAHSWTVGIGEKEKKSHTQWRWARKGKTGWK